MLSKIVQKYQSFISVLLLLVLLAGLVFFPASASALASFMFVLGPGTAIAFIVNRQVKAHHTEHIDCAYMLRNIFFETLGLLITIALSVVLVQIVVAMTSPLVNGWGYRHGNRFVPAGWLGCGMAGQGDVGKG
ncbi:MAG: hypothetical protein M1282_00495 [Chloroflexi bacterium]|nr:hypothetical protein [Chloroflexota bacterium]